MKVIYTTADGRLTVELEGKTQVDIFEQISQFQEVFEAAECSVMTPQGRKTSNKVRFLVREDDEENKYYEMLCVDSDEDLRGRKLAFGQHKKGGTLFPHRTDKNADGTTKYLKNGGWGRYNKDKKEIVYD